MGVLSKPRKDVAPTPARRHKCLAPYATADYLDYHNQRAGQLASSLSVMMFEDTPYTQLETRKYDPLYDGDDPSQFKRRIVKGRRKEAPNTVNLMSRDTKNEDEKLVEQSNGAKVFRKITRMVTKTKHIKLLDYQLRLIEMCLVPAIPGIYGHMFDKLKGPIYDCHGIKKQLSEVCFVSARRMGKTKTTSTFADTLALTVKSNDTQPMKIAVFSTTKASAMQFIDECVIMLDCLRWDKSQWKVKVTAMWIRFENLIDGRKSIIRAFATSKVSLILIWFVWSRRTNLRHTINPCLNIML